MSGGHFDYQQYKMGEIAESIEDLIERSPDEDWMKYSSKTLETFKNAVFFLRISEIYAQRIDWLVSGDDGEDTFHKRLAEDFKALADE